MSKLQDLIDRLCPNGVEFKPLGEIAEIGTGSSDKKDADVNGDYPFFVRSKIVERYNSFEFDEEAVIIPGEGGIGEIFHYINGPYALHQRVYRIHFTSTAVKPRFAYYYLFAHFKGFIMKKAVSATVTSIRKPMIETFPLAIPPLAVQEEIVKILDRCADYAVELQAELQARKEQYEYYRNLLLTFNPSAYGSGTDDEQKDSITRWGGHSYKIQWKTMGEIGNVKMCKRIMKNQTSSMGDVPFYKIGTFGKEPDAYISRELFEDYKHKYSFPSKGTILISAAGTIGRCVIYDGEDAYFQDSNIVWLENDEKQVLNSYLYYFFYNSFHIE